MTGTDEQLEYGTGRGRGALWATVLGSGMAQLDATVVNVALPRIGTNLHAGFTSLQWTINAYTLTLSGLLLLGGSLGDRLGRRRIFVLGTIWFTIASLACALAPTAGLLVAMRGLQGVGGALLTPGSLAILQAVFRPKDRATAVGAWSGLGGVASALGPIIGGVLIGVAGWGWRLIFLINLPLAVVVVVLARKFIPETRDDSVKGRIDITGAILACVGLGAVVFALTEGPAASWPGRDYVVLVVGVAILAAFIFVESRALNPLLPLELFRIRQFAATNAVTLAVYGALSGALFLLPVVLQRVLSYSPLGAGASLLPVTILMLLLSARMGALATRIGPRIPMTVGPIVAGLGMMLFARIGIHGHYLTDVLPAVLVFAFGLTITVAPLTATVLAAAPSHQVGVASAINNDIARVAGLLAVAVLPGVAGITPAAYLNAGSLIDGFHRAVFIAGALCAAGGVLSAVFVQGKLAPSDADPPGEGSAKASA